MRTRKDANSAPGSALVRQSSTERARAVGPELLLEGPEPLPSNLREFIRNSASVLEALCREGRVDVGLARAALRARWAHRRSPADSPVSRLAD